MKKGKIHKLKSGAAKAKKMLKFKPSSRKGLDESKIAEDGCQ